MIRLHGYRANLEKEVIESWRTYRLILLSALFVAVGIGAAVITRYLPELEAAVAAPDAELGLEATSVPDVIDLLVTGLVQAGALAAVLLAMGALAGERERRTAWLVLVRPVSRAGYVWAKLVALGMVFALAIALGVLAAWLYTTLFYGSQGLLGWAQLGGVVWLSTMVYVAITFVGSAFAETPLGAAGIGVAAIVGLGLASTVTGLASWLPTGLDEVARLVVLEEVSSDVDPPRTIAVSVGLILVCALLASWRIGREEA